MLRDIFVFTFRQVLDRHPIRTHAPDIVSPPAEARSFQTPDVFAAAFSQRRDVSFPIVTRSRYGSGGMTEVLLDRHIHPIRRHEQRDGCLAYTVRLEGVQRTV